MKNRKSTGTSSSSVEQPVNSATRQASTTNLRDQVIQLIDSENYEAALGILRNHQREPALRNALGVCLLRMGRTDEAVRLYRDFVLQPGCTWTAAHLPLAYKINFATSLFLGGRPSGCLEILWEVNDEAHPGVIRLRAAIARWQRQLPFWQWLNWRMGRIDPARRPTDLGYPPGDFGVAITPAAGSQPQRSEPSLRTSA